MKNIIKSSFVALSVALASTVFVTGLSTKSASAVEMSANCLARPLSTLSETANNKVTVKFYIEPGCPSQEVSLMVYKRPTQTLPLSSQKMFSFVSSVYPAGEHTVTTSLPADDCFYQADLFRSGPIYQLEDRSYADIIMGHLLGGSNDCLAVPITTTAPVTVTPVTVAAVTPAVPVEEAAAAATSLPNTGPGSLVATLAGVAATSSLGYYLYARRRFGL